MGRLKPLTIDQWREVGLNLRVAKRCLIEIVRVGQVALGVNRMKPTYGLVGQIEKMAFRMENFACEQFGNDWNFGEAFHGRVDIEFDPTLAKEIHLYRPPTREQWRELGRLMKRARRELMAAGLAIESSLGKKEGRLILNFVDRKVGMVRSKLDSLLCTHQPDWEDFGSVFYGADS